MLRSDITDPPTLDLKTSLKKPLQWAFAAALLAATNTPSYPGTENSQDQEDKYVTFWKKWATEHQEKVDFLRAQFLAPLPTKAAH